MGAKVDVDRSHEDVKMLGSQDEMGEYDNNQGVKPPVELLQERLLRNSVEVRNHQQKNEQGDESGAIGLWIG